jgi:hypothetical protein
VKFECIQNEFREEYRVMQNTKLQALLNSNNRLTKAIDSRKWETPNPNLGLDHETPNSSVGYGYMG